MREILFRGKTDKGEWVEGDFLNGGYDYKTAIRVKIYGGGIHCAEVIKVIPETVGQFTGLTDKNGKKIFEGDILEGLCGLHEVYFDEDFVCFDWKNISGKQKESFSGFADEYEIIGKIHDNPELLKGGAENA